MNFILIVSDTLRRDHLGCYGNHWISTPNIDRFAAKAQAFDRAYCGSFPTVPHRRDLLTGRFTATYTGWAPLGSDEIVLAQVLGEGGYLTMMVCDCPHILENGYHYDRGFAGFEWIRGQETDRWKTHPETPEHPCDPAKIRSAERLQRLHRRNVAGWTREADRFVARTMTAASEWLEHNYRRDRFFLYVDTFDPHEPWDAPQWYVDMYDPGYTGQVVDYPLYAYADFLSEAELKHCRALYAAEVSLMDRWVGRLFEKIEDLGLLHNTVVILTSDHGFLHGEHGIMGKGLIGPQGFSYVPLYEQINHIPLLVYQPGTKPCRRDAVVQPMDIMPTVLALADMESPATVHGESFGAVLAGQSPAHHRFAVSAPYLRAEAIPVTVIRDRWTAVLHPAAQATRQMTDRAIDGYAKRQTSDRQIADMLFDLTVDPDQKGNVADQHPEVVGQLRQDLLGFLEKIGTAEDILRLWSPHCE